MSIERIELSGAAMVGRYPTESPAQAASPHGKATNKSLQRHLARTEYHTAIAREEAIASNMVVKAKSEKYAYAGEININGANISIPLHKYNAGYVYQNFFHYKNSVGKIVDRMA